MFLNPDPAIRDGGCGKPYRWIGVVFRDYIGIHCQGAFAPGSHLVEPLDFGCCTGLLCPLRALKVGKQIIALERWHLPCQPCRQRERRKAEDHREYSHNPPPEMTWETQRSHGVPPGGLAPLPALSLVRNSSAFCCLTESAYACIL